MVEKLKNGLGFLLVAFVAALNFLGLRNSEITSVLRNDPQDANIVGCLMLLSLTVAVTAILVDDHEKMPPYFVPAIFAACIGMVSLVFRTINIPLQTASDTWDIAAICTGALVLAMLLIGFCWCGWRNSWEWIYKRRWFPNRKQGGLRQNENEGEKNARQKNWPSVTSVLLVCAVILTAVATFAAARLEVKSQAAAAYPGISAAIKNDGPSEVISLTITGSKLASGDKIGLIVQAIPRNVDLKKLCSGSWRLDNCLYKGICIRMTKNPCDVIASSSLQPDPSGDINVTIDEQVTMSEYQFVDARAQICDINVITPSANCHYDQNKISFVFLRIPLPDSASRSGSQFSGPVAPAVG